MGEERGSSSSGRDWRLSSGGSTCGWEGGWVRRAQAEHSPTPFGAARPRGRPRRPLPAGLWGRKPASTRGSVGAPRAARHPGCAAADGTKGGVGRREGEQPLGGVEPPNPWLKSPLPCRPRSKRPRRGALRPPHPPPPPPPPTLHRHATTLPGSDVVGCRAVCVCAGMCVCMHREHSTAVHGRLGRDRVATGGVAAAPTASSCAFARVGSGDPGRGGASGGWGG